MLACFDARGLQGVRQLTRLRLLTLNAPEHAEGLLLQLIQLKQLTSLNYVGPTSSWNGTQTSKVTDGG